MKVLIEMPLERYDLFLQRCHETSCPEFAILKYATFNRRPNGDRFLRTMQIHCEMAQAKRLLNLAAKLCPGAVPDIEKAIGALPGA
jgi:hypothetical protein